VDEVVGAILESNESLDWIWFWGRRASEAELEPVLRLATTSAPPIVLENVLCCLSGAARPPITPRLFDFLEHSDLNVRRHCASTLGRHVQPRIRAAGLAALQVDLPTALELLCKNAVQEDADAIVGALRPIEDRDDQHDVVRTLIEMLRDNAPSFDPRIALYVYENSPCMQCRANAVRALEAQRSVPQWLRVECSHDALADIRQIVAATENAI
jgi:HEAT repeat protein